MIIHTEGIVLKSMDIRETSRIATFFTRDHGKVKGILKGIRKDPQKFGSNIDKFSVNDIVYYQYRRSDLHLVSQCDLRQFFFPVRRDYQRSLAANYILELADIIMPSEEANQSVYQLILDYLNALESIKDIDKLVRIFQIKILLHSGFSPHLDSCVKCARPVKGKARFSLASGGLVCPACPTAEQRFSLISPGTISSILHIERGQWKQCLQLGLTTTTRRELKFILNNFLVYHLERQIKTSKYL